MMMSVTQPDSHKVCFTSVEVREYPRILGDNPSVSAGPPISLAWKHDDTARMLLPLEDWERAREPDRRSKQEIRVPDHVRVDWLMDAGFTGSELRRVIDAIEQDKKDRRSSICKSDFQDKADVIAENVKRKFERVVGRRPKSNALYKQWSKSGEKQERRSSV